MLPTGQSRSSGPRQSPTRYDFILPQTDAFCQYDYAVFYIFHHVLPVVIVGNLHLEVEARLAVDVKS